MASKIIVDQLESSGSNITIPTGTGLVVTDGIPATNLSGTIADARLPTVPVSKGGTGLTSLGSANQVLRTNSSANALEFGTVSSDHTGVALIEYIMTSGFNDLQSVAGITTGTNTQLPFNTVQDPYNILGTVGSNVFQVNTTGAYLFNVTWSSHNLVHYVHPYLYNDTDSKYAEIPNSGFTGVDANKGGAPGPGYVTSSDPTNPGAGVFYYLETGHNYSVRVSTENSGNGLGSSVTQLQAQHTVGGVARRLAPLRVELTKMGSV